MRCDVCLGDLECRSGFWRHERSDVDHRPVLRAPANVVYDGRDEVPYPAGLEADLMTGVVP